METSSEASISREQKEKELEKITVVLDWVPNTNHTGIYVAEAKGYYREYGFEIEIIQPSEGGSADLIAAGQGNFGISYQEQVTYARTASTPLPVIAVATIIQHNTSGFASPVEKNIKTPLDFEGKKYGGWGSPMEEAMLKGLMNKYGGDFEKIELVNIGAADFFTSVTRDVDFTWIYYGWDGIAAEVKDFKINFMLLQNLDNRLDFYTPVIIVSEKTAKEQPEMIKSFLAATGRGYMFASENYQEAASLLLSSVPELQEDIVVASQEYLAGKYIEPDVKWGHMDSLIWKTFGDWMYENKLIDTPLDEGEAFTNEFLP
ncbi:MAG: ABC transporter substrate-binding protein [Actinobacteria bacterium]|nr:ABC transporter substrate-binding protein [Actinomycetota bacterium]